MKKKRSIDLNADVGELPYALGRSRDEQLIQYVSSISIACGGHAGDYESMARTLEMARKYGIAAGAHPSYPDRENFGRLHVQMSNSELRSTLLEQIQTLRGISQHVGVRIGHVKPHGALYHDANALSGIASVIAKVVQEVDPSMVLFGQAGKAAVHRYRELGCRAASEAFADRRYDPEGNLLGRTAKDALLLKEAAAAQALDIALRGNITSCGRVLAIEAETICVHSDAPDSVAIVQAVRQELEAHGVKVNALWKAG